MNDRKNQKSEKGRPIVAFWNKHKKEIKVVTGVIGFIGAGVLAALGIRYVWNATAFDRWFDKASLPELQDARNKIHDEYLKHTVNDEYRESLWNMLPKFDKRISELKWAGRTPTAPSYPREHGHNLYKPD